MSRLQQGIFLVLGILVSGSLSLFTVKQTQYAMVFEFGKPKREIKEAGIHFMVPLIQNVRYFDKRIQTIDPEAPDLYNTREKKNLKVDSYVKWRIKDVSLFNTSLGGDVLTAQARLKQIVNDRLRAEFGQRTVAEVISGKRSLVMDTVKKKTNEETLTMGVEIVDVRLKRVDFPNEISESVFLRMDSERRTEANLLRSEGEAESERIRADADKAKAIILANAYKKAQILKGEGDKTAAAIYAQAYGKNAEFYAFWRSMEAYKATFKDKKDVMVLDTNAAFFKYFKQPQTGATTP
ncbi:MAG: protease modulator HflC [Neisseriaceae bacterium]|nr:protease modulator HflC [Neisseriaceae bacterium]